MPTKGRSFVVAPSEVVYISSASFFLFIKVSIICQGTSTTLAINTLKKYFRIINGSLKILS
jgi:hypothetical protein